MRIYDRITLVYSGVIAEKKGRYMLRPESGVPKNQDQAGRPCFFPQNISTEEKAEVCLKQGGGPRQPVPPPGRTGCSDREQRKPTLEEVGLMVNGKNQGENKL